MHKLPPLILFGLIAAVFCLPALSADEKDRGRAGAGASSEGGASLGGTGIDSGVANQRGTDERDKRIQLQRKPKPEELKDLAPAEPKPPAERGNASSGATSKGSADLSEEADKHDEEFRRKQRIERRK